MKKRILIAVLAIAVLFILYKQFKGDIASWYVDNYVPHPTRIPAASHDGIFLTWSEDPATTQTIQWRSSPATTTGMVQYRLKSDPNAAPAEVDAELSAKVHDPLLDNDTDNNLFTAVLRNLAPGTAYAYRVSPKQHEDWSDWREFTTAPGQPVPYSFVYLGDPQIGMEYWDKLLHNAYARTPQAAFYMIAGDNVNNGSYRNEWDVFFQAGRGVFDRVPVMPTAGNHDYDGHDIPQLYLDTFALPTNGAKGITPERSYSFHYSNTLFVVLDSNGGVEEQTGWLEDLLAHSTDTWKIAMYHHPMFSSAEHRDNDEVRTEWGPVFDKYHLDFALQGHDHAYLRTYPMKGGKKVDSAKEGTYYVVSVSGTKYYKQGKHDYAAVETAKTSTYQVLDIGMNPDKLTYRAYDIEGKVLDEVVIEK